MRFKNGDKVVMCNAEKSLKYPEFYPPAGTQGVIRNVNNGDITAMVSWPHDSGVDYNDLFNDWCWAVDINYLMLKEEYLQQENNGLRKDKAALEKRIDKMSVDILYFKELAKKIVDA